MAEPPAAGGLRLQPTLVFTALLVVGQIVLITGSAGFFRAMNSDIPDDLLAGLLTDQADPMLRAEALHARLAWIVSVVVAIFASVGATVLAVTKIMKEAEPLRRRLLITVAGLSLVTAAVATISDVSREILQQPVLEPTIGAMTVGGIDVAESFAGIRQVVNALFSAATVALVVALATRASIGATQAAIDGRDLGLRERFNDLHELLLGAAAVLVSIVITMAAWLAWPTAGLADDSLAFVTITHIGQGVGLYWGTVFSLCLVLAYLPCIAYLKHLSAGGPESVTEGAPRRPVKLLQDVMALVSPLISALIPVFLI